MVTKASGKASATASSSTGKDKKFMNPKAKAHAKPDAAAEPDSNATPGASSAATDSADTRVDHTTPLDNVGFMANVEAAALQADRWVDQAVMQHMISNTVQAMAALVANARGLMAMQAPPTSSTDHTTDDGTAAVSTNAPNKRTPEPMTQSSFRWSQSNSNWATAKRQRAAAHRAQLEHGTASSAPRTSIVVMCKICDMHQPKSRCTFMACGRCCPAKFDSSLTCLEVTHYFRSTQ